MIEDNLIKKKELAERLNVHRNTVSAMEKLGAIRGIHLGTGAVRYSYKDVIENLKLQQEQHRERIK
jgi:hypothetical protein